MTLEEFTQQYKMKSSGIPYVKLKGPGKTYKGTLGEVHCAYVKYVMSRHNGNFFPEDWDFLTSRYPIKYYLTCIKDGFCVKYNQKRVENIFSNGMSQAFIEASPEKKMEMEGWPPSMRKPKDAGDKIAENAFAAFLIAFVAIVIGVICYYVVWPILKLIWMLSSGMFEITASDGGIGSVIAGVFMFVFVAITILYIIIIALKSF